ncbi:cytosolic Fe-S cluster assembly factor NUBP2 isoform X1 [Neomonachus schauinslandi]|uniref:Cytosolic Fe-S cluster assembly factor NUBP2 isoform X1 n=1 Tax=Neomonachus schauinslandi TaxID=29088 RepID=A0A2Y9HQJ1_NEOSC|nr:cytosolic Fe-S cluster assembly factor NUBP2 isoform X1 [Neomonachus schauinslandi]XP_021553862.1 cytosolic Fe-S cluster assembly factor NUBP2 isoform X1 [Neomonachus schauinslandi]XP_021553863.1 cytosolic Fe-S cluster assembly factor NUBP2 isoform X1 [Neomonachus schauinslandi]
MDRSTQRQSWVLANTESSRDLMLDKWQVRNLKLASQEVQKSSASQYHSCPDPSHKHLVFIHKGKRPRSPKGQSWAVSLPGNEELSYSCSNTDCGATGQVCTPGCSPQGTDEWAPTPGGGGRVLTTSIYSTLTGTADRGVRSKHRTPGWTNGKAAEEGKVNAYCALDHRKDFFNETPEYKASSHLGNDCRHAWQETKAPCDQREQSPGEKWGGPPGEAAVQRRKPKWAACVRNGIQPPRGGSRPPHGGLHAGVADMGQNVLLSRNACSPWPACSARVSVSEPHVADPRPQPHVWLQSPWGWPSRTPSPKTTHAKDNS